MNSSCPTHPTPQDQNLDCYVSPEQLDAFIGNDHFPKEFQDYAQEKQKAMTARLSGNIQEALKHEETCQTLYDQIPKPFQW